MASDPEQSSSSSEEIDVLKQAIEELEKAIEAEAGSPSGGSSFGKPQGDSEGHLNHDLTSLELDGDDVFGEARGQEAAQLPIHTQRKPDPFEQLGEADDAPVARNPSREPIPLGDSPRSRTPKPKRSERIEVRPAELERSVPDAPEPAAAPSKRQRSPLKESLDLPANSAVTVAQKEALPEEEDPDLGHLSQASLALKLVLGGVFLALIAGMIKLSLNDPVVEDTTSKALAEVRSEVNSNMDSTQKLIESFWGAPTLSEKLPYVWEADRVEPIMRRYYEAHPLPLARHLVEYGLVTNRLGHMHSELPESFPLAEGRDEIGKKVPIILRDTRNTFLIDWEATFGYNAREVSELLTHGSGGPVDLRLLVIEGDYYNFGYSEDVHTSYALKTISDDDPLFFGFVEDNSEPHQALKTLFANREMRLVAVTLTLNFAPDSGTTLCVDIVAVKALHWAW